MTDDATKKPPGLPLGANVIGTDPLGDSVWITAATAAFKANLHDELTRSPQWTTAAVETPYVIADHPEKSDRQIYVGQAREASDPALAPTRRILVVSTSRDTRGMFITGYDHRRSRLPIGPIRWRAGDD